MNLIKKAELTEPCEIKRIGLERPSERQLKYAFDLGIFIPDDASKDDASILITRAEDGLPIIQEKAPTEILDVLIRRLGVYIPSYAGKKEMNSAFYWSMKTYEERYAYFAMKVYAQATGKNYHFIHEATPGEQEKFHEFARAFKGDKSFTQSYDRYEPWEISITEKIKRKLKAYELAEKFLT